MQRSFWLAVCLVALAGCSRPPAQEPSTDSVKVKPDPVPKSGGEATAKTEPSPEPKSPDAKAPVATGPKPAPAVPGVRPQKPYEVAPPGTDAWTKSDLTLTQLAAKVDRAMNTLTNTYAETLLMVNNGEVQGQVKGSIRVGARDRYYIEYQLPENPVKNRVLARNGKLVASFANDRWKLGLPAPGAKALPKWSDQFTESMFLSAVQGKGVWSQLAKELGVQKGLTTTVERRVLPLSGQPRPFYRVVTKGKDGRAIELRFDGKRFVPLTIKSVSKNPQGAQVSSQWQAVWSFNRPLTPAEVKIPIAANAR